MSKEKKRTKVFHKKPNPLFEKWLEEWRDEAVQKNSNLQYSLSKALRSLKRFPLPLKTGKDCLILDNFGPNLCGKLDKRLEDYRKTHPLSSCDELTDVDALNSALVTSNQPKTKKAAKKRKLTNEEEVGTSLSPVSKKQRPYVPSFRSGAYAILLALYQNQSKNNYPGFMTKAELQNSAQSLCDASFYKPDPGSYYTAWASMATLIKKALISKTGNPARFSLTIEGAELAKRLEEVDFSSIQSNSSANDKNRSQSQTSIYRATPKKKTSLKGKRPLKKNAAIMYANVLDNESDPDEPDAVDPSKISPSTYCNSSIKPSSVMQPSNKFSPKFDWPNNSTSEDESEKINGLPTSSIGKKVMKDVIERTNKAISSNLDSYVISSSEDESPQNKYDSSFRQIKNASSTVNHCSITKGNTSITIELSDSDDDNLHKRSMLSSCKKETLQLDRSPQLLNSHNKNAHTVSDIEDDAVPYTSILSNKSSNKTEKNSELSYSLSDDEFDLMVKNTISSKIDKYSALSSTSSTSKNQCLVKDDALSPIDHKGVKGQAKEKCTFAEDVIPTFQQKSRNANDKNSPLKDAPGLISDLYFGDSNDYDYSLSPVQWESEQPPEAKGSTPDFQNELMALTSQSSSKYSPKKTTSKGSPKKSSNNSQSSSDASDFFILMPDLFEIILLVDEQESNNRAKPLKPFIRELENSGIKFEVRHLKIGDYIWIARCKKTNAEVVLPYIIERKRMDDFGKSIKDGRFHEQKIRLKQSGIEKLIYLVEMHSGNFGIPETTIHQAAINTYVRDCFQLKYTSDYRHSASYLATLTRLISKQFKDKTIASCDKNSLPTFDPQSDFVSLMTFKDFSKGMSKVRNYTIKEMFIKHLLQLFGMSVEKAVAITDRFPTPKSLLLAFENGGQENMLASITFGTPKRTIGAALSKNIFQFYTLKHFP